MAETDIHHRLSQNSPLEVLQQSALLEGNSLLWLIHQEFKSGSQHTWVSISKAISPNLLISCKLSSGHLRQSCIALSRLNPCCPRAVCILTLEHQPPSTAGKVCGTVADSSTASSASSCQLTLLRPFLLGRLDLHNHHPR